MVSATEPKPQNWTLPKDAVLPEDTLTSCLVILTRLHHHPFSAQTLTAGLPLVDSKLTPELFPRAADRAGLSAKVVKRSLADISNLTLPAILLLKGERACVLVSKDEDDNFVIIQPETGAGETKASGQKLEAEYAGFIIFARPAFKFDSRTQESAIPRSQHWFWGVVRHAWPLYGEVLIASFLINVFALVMPLFVMNIYDRVVPNQAFSTLWVLGIGASIVFIFDFFMRGLRAYFIDTAGKQVDIMLSATIFEKVLGIQAAARPPSVGAFASNLQEFESFRDFITSATISTIIDLPFILLFLGLIAWIGGWVVLVPLIAIPIIVLTGLALQKKLAAVIQETFRTSAQRQAILIESLTGMETIKSMGAEGPMQRKWEQIIGRLGKLGLRAKLLSSVIVNQATLVQQLANIGVVVVGVYLISNNALTVGGLIACTILSGRILAPLSQVAALLTRYHHAVAALKGLDTVMQLPVERPAGRSFVHRPEFHGDIEFRNVTFSYPGQATPALNNVSFKIKRGECVGFIGRIGSGKTTIEKLILGLYQPAQGSIWIDGVDMQQIDPADLRRNIGYVPQDILLFYGTVKNNIVIGAPYIDDAAMLKAAEIAGVSEFVNRHPQGFDMPVGERGEGLSGGQRQSIAIARAMLLSPPILVMDEPSNSLDNRSEENLKTRLSKQMVDSTLLLVTHRASLLTLVSRLIVLDGGRVIADGPKEQVLEALSGGKLHAAKV